MRATRQQCVGRLTRAHHLWPVRQLGLVDGPAESEQEGVSGRQYGSLVGQAQTPLLRPYKTREIKIASNLIFLIFFAYLKGLIFDNVSSWGKPDNSVRRSYTHQSNVPPGLTNLSEPIPKF